LSSGDVTRWCRRLFGAVCLTVACLAGPAAATIVPGQGIAGVRLDMTEVQVHAILGPPGRVTRSRGALGTVVTRLHYPRIDVDLQRVAGKKPVVVRVVTTTPRERTPSGVGVGSRLGAVARLSGSRCWAEGTTRYCAVGRRNRPLDRFTLFWLGDGGRVTRVVVALVVDG